MNNQQFCMLIQRNILMYVKFLNGTKLCDYFNFDLKIIKNFFKNECWAVVSLLITRNEIVFFKKSTKND